MRNRLSQTRVPWGGGRRWEMCRQLPGRRGVFCSSASRFVSGLSSGNSHNFMWIRRSVRFFFFLSINSALLPPAHEAAFVSEQAPGRFGCGRLLLALGFFTCIFICLWKLCKYSRYTVMRCSAKLLASKFPHLRDVYCKIFDRWS